MKEAVNKGGRPAMGPKTGKAAAFSSRITPETRAMMEREAAETGQSVSQVAERWLEQAYAAKELGGPQVGDALLAMGKFARLVEAELGRHPSEDLIARDALLAGWQAMLPTLLPLTPDSPQGVQLKIQRAAVILACRQLLTAVDATPDGYPIEGDPVVAILIEPVKATENAFHYSNLLAGNALSRSRITDWSLWRAIQEGAEHKNLADRAVLQMMEDRLPLAIAAGDFLHEELGRLRDLLATYTAILWKYGAERSAALLRGRELAASVSGLEAMPASDRLAI